MSYDKKRDWNELDKILYVEAFEQDKWVWTCEEILNFIRDLWNIKARWSPTGRGYIVQLINSGIIKPRGVDKDKFLNGYNGSLNGSPGRKPFTSLRYSNAKKRLFVIQDPSSREPSLYSRREEYLERYDEIKGESPPIIGEVKYRLPYPMKWTYEAGMQGHFRKYLKGCGFEIVDTICYCDVGAYLDGDLYLFELKNNKDVDDSGSIHQILKYMIIEKEGCGEEPVGVIVHSQYDEGMKKLIKDYDLSLKYWIFHEKDGLREILI